MLLALCSLSLSAGTLVVNNGGMFMAGFAGDDAFRPMFPLSVGRPKILGITVGMTRRTVCCDHGLLWTSLWLYRDVRVDPQ